MKEEMRLANCIADSISPPIFPEIFIHSWNDKELIIIKVSHGMGPYHLISKGEVKGTYLRLGSSNRNTDETILAELKRLTVNQAFDETPAINLSLDDLDLAAAKEWFSKAEKPFNLNKGASLNLYLNKQNKAVPTIGGILLFGKSKSDILPDAIVRCARFLGRSKAEVLDHKEIDAHLPDSLELVLQFIKRHTQTRAKFGALIREDIPEYPTQIVREAVINALLHADYSVKGSSIMIAIFDDRIEISNPGTLPFGLTLDDAIGGMSQIRNRVIARVFKELRLIEQWGSGLGRMIEESKRLGLKTPLFEEAGYFFRCTLFSERVSPLVLESWEEKLIDYLEHHDKILAKELPVLWKISKRTARSRIYKMIEDGKIIEFASSKYDPHKWYSLSIQKNK